MTFKNVSLQSGEGSFWNKNQNVMYQVYLLNILQLYDICIHNMYIINCDILSI